VGERGLEPLTSPVCRERANNVIGHNLGTIERSYFAVDRPLLR